MKRGHWLLLLLAACGPASLTIAMYPQNNSGESGVAVLTEKNGALVVDVTLDSELATTQKAHIHHFRCGEIGIVAHSLTDLSVADAGVLGSHTELAGVKLADVSDGGFCINVHDERSYALYVSCGDIN